jgi:hypothetical protein
MIDQLSVETTRTTARLARSRQELIDLFAIERREDVSEGEFPRSHTIRLLMRSRSLGALAALAAGLLIARPLTAWRLLRALPLGVFARGLLVRLLTATGTTR